jgi:hypothetical protein
MPCLAFLNAGFCRGFRSSVTAVVMALGQSDAVELFKANHTVQTPFRKRLAHKRALTGIRPLKRAERTQHFILTMI